MTTIKIEGHMHFNEDRYLGKRYKFFEGEPWHGTHGEYIPVCPYTIEFELPADFNPVVAQVHALEAEKAKLMAEFNERVAQINGRIRDLQCLPAPEAS